MSEHSPDTELMRENESHPHTRPVQLLYATKGFARVFWGIFVALLLFAGIASINFKMYVYLPSYILGTLTVYWGLTYLHAVGPLTPDWLKRIRIAFTAVFLQIYFSPFVYWWEKSPHGNYFMCNILALAFVTFWLLLTLNQLVRDLAIALNDRAFRAEAQLCVWSVVLLAILPLAGITAFGLYAMIKYSTTLYSVLLLPGTSLVPHWIYGLFLFPFTFTMVCAWKAQNRCLEMLRGVAEVPPPRAHGHSGR
ncbi:MAG: hypothetical protein KJ626_02430 [Verrucomicrobia bacterium]|nr:hypothetical protein [Verrucomicrobiota bacterium]